MYYIVSCIIVAHLYLEKPIHTYYIPIIVKCKHDKLPRLYQLVLLVITV